MNRNSIITAIAVIIFLPFVYLAYEAFKGDPPPRFHGEVVTMLDPVDGTLTVPSAADEKNGAPLTVKVTSAYVEKVTGKKALNAKGLEFAMHVVSERLQECDEESKIPAKASLRLATLCAPVAFEKMKDPNKTMVLIDPVEQLVVLGSKGKNQAFVFHNGMNATYMSADMTQSDRKYEACLVRILMDDIRHLDLTQAKTCMPIP